MSFLWVVIFACLYMPVVYLILRAKGEDTAKRKRLSTLNEGGDDAAAAVKSDDDLESMSVRRSEHKRPTLSDRITGSDMTPTAPVVPQDRVDDDEGYYSLRDKTKCNRYTAGYELDKLLDTNNMKCEHPVGPDSMFVEKQHEELEEHKHQPTTEVETKSLLTPDDDKRFILDDGVAALAQAEADEDEVAEIDKRKELGEREGVEESIKMRKAKQERERYAALGVDKKKVVRERKTVAERQRWAKDTKRMLRRMLRTEVEKQKTRERNAAAKRVRRAAEKNQS
jgi:hypothetical protein